MSEPSPDFLTVFRAHADPALTMPFARFMALALYHPEVGYYRRPQVRVGRERGTDFFTATSSGPLFGELIVVACRHLLALQGARPEDHTWVEIGAEPGTSVLAGVDHPWAAVRTVSVGEGLALSGHCIVFSNELFDAQPFSRHVRAGGVWREIGVALREDRLTEVLLGRSDSPLLPPAAPEGYHCDLPEGAARLLQDLVAAPWSGFFLAFDYGKDRAELATDTPSGTARAYYRHTQSNDLLARPGEQDLTCHLCWDDLEEILHGSGFAAVRRDSQEAFFVRHAAPALAAAMAAEAKGFSPRKQSLLQLLHPAHLGQKFQALHAWRAAPPNARPAATARSLTESFPRPGAASAPSPPGGFR